MPDEERSFVDLQARIAKTIAFLTSVPREAIDGKEGVTVTLTTPGGSFDFTGLGYALDFVLAELLLPCDDRLCTCCATKGFRLASWITSAGSEG